MTPSEVVLLFVILVVSSRLDDKSGHHLKNSLCLAAFKVFFALLKFLLCLFDLLLVVVGLFMISLLLVCS